MLSEKAPYADVYDMLGVIYHQEGRLAEAEQMFNEALRINPAYTEAALNLVVTWNDLGKYAEAKAIYERAMATSKREPRELDPFAKGKIANMHAEVGAAYRAVPLLRGSDPRIRARAGAVPDVRRHPHRARRHAPRDGRHRRARSASSSACARRARASSPAG